jgi:23S rRNA pseudoU1915 N3-methylase RlmH
VLLDIHTGGADGLPVELRPHRQSEVYPVYAHISLSRMTFTHVFARVMLVEQMYRVSQVIAPRMLQWYDGMANIV